MGLIQESINFLNENNGALTVLINIILVSITGVYVYLTASLSKASNKTIEHSYNEYKDRKSKDETVKKNLIYLVNSEIYMNSFIYVFSQYYLQNGEHINLKEKLKHYLISGGVSIDKTSRGHIVVHTRMDTWKEINAQCAQYFSNSLMQELTGYYTGVEQSKIYSVKGMSNQNFIEFSKGQLISTYKCLDLLKQEDPNLRIGKEYNIDGKVLAVNKETGTLVEINKHLEQAVSK